MTSSKSHGRNFRSPTHHGSRAWIRSPANASMLNVEERTVNRQPDQVDDKLVGPALRQGFGELRRMFADDDYVGADDDLVDRVAEQRGQVRDLVLDVFLVGADQARERHVLVVDAQRESFAQKRFSQNHDRALAKVVCPGLETESQQADLGLPVSSTCNAGGVYRQQRRD